MVSTWWPKMERYWSSQRDILPRGLKTFFGGGHYEVTSAQWCEFVKSALTDGFVSRDLGGELGGSLAR